LITRIEDHAIQHVVYAHDPLDPIITASITNKRTIISKAKLLPSNNPQPILTHAIIPHTILPNTIIPEAELLPILTRTIIPRTIIPNTIIPVIQHVVYAHDPKDPILAASMTRPPGVHFTCNANHNMISRHAINALTTREQCTPNVAFRHNEMNPRQNTLPANMNHYANPMVHPVTGNIVSSYKKAMHDADIGNLWQTAF
jgi:hypothetical protein